MNPLKKITNIIMKKYKEWQDNRQKRRNILQYIERNNIKLPTIGDREND